MNIQFNHDMMCHVKAIYKSKSQIARVVTEHWVANNAYCPSCGYHQLSGFKNNRPVADFYCSHCLEEFELKSKQESISKIITNGAFDTMIQRIHQANNPNLFVLNYTADGLVDNFTVIPKHFFTSDIIIKRKPLSDNARRAGWVGCNIDISQVPNVGKVAIIKNGIVNQPNLVINSFRQGFGLKDIALPHKGWLLDILLCIDKLNKSKFSLQELYAFENYLQIKHPNNANIQAKIRQQLQILRNKGFINFLGNGYYQRIGD
ncbi:MAG: DpnI domain-containing protein [Moraxella sp.]|nr:DpnI domain-containing protein [Moraxella sp.]